MIGGVKLNLVLMDHMKNEKIVVEVQLELVQGTLWEARKNKHLPKHICGVLTKYKDVLKNELLKKWVPKEMENNFAQQEIEFLSHVVTIDRIKPDMRKIKIIWEWKWPLIQKGLEWLFGLAIYYRRFIQDSSKVAKTLSNF